VGRIASIRGKATSKSPLQSLLLMRAKSFTAAARAPWEAVGRLWIKGPLDRGEPAQKRPHRLVSSTIPGSERYAEAKQLVEDHPEEIADPWHRRSPE